MIELIVTTISPQNIHKTRSSVDNIDRKFDQSTDFDVLLAILLLAHHWLTTAIVYK